MVAIDVKITAPFALGDVPTVVETDGGEISLWLRAGAFRGELPAHPRRLRLVEVPSADDAVPVVLDRGEAAGAPTGTVVDVEALFEHGVDIPETGRLELQIRWGCCHHHDEDEPRAEGEEGRRFGSFEHIECAAWVGRDAAGEPLGFGGIDCEIDARTKLEVGGKQLTFGQIIALAGDFYAHYDDDAARDFEWAWPNLHGLTGWLAGDYRAATLVSDTVGVSRDILDIVERDRKISRSTAGEFAALALDAVTTNYPARRYLALASQNMCHFASQPSTGQIDDERNLALRLYRAYHARAIALARQARTTPQSRMGLKAAFACDAFGCHFLTDIFASGHMRVPRRELNEQFGILRGALRMANAMHGEDNHLGLWCVARGLGPPGRRTVWRAFGDGRLQRDEARAHLARVQAAVRSSVAEVFAAWCDLPTGEPQAEDHVPVPLRPGDGPGTQDVVEGDADPATRNHYPMFWLLADGRIARRDGGPERAEYVVLNGGERKTFA